MKNTIPLTFRVRDLRPVVSALSKIVSRKPSKSGYHEVMVRPQGHSQVIITGTDGEFTLSVKVTLISEGKFEPFLIPLSVIQKLLKGKSVNDTIDLPRPRSSGILPDSVNRFRSTTIEVEPEAVLAIQKAFQYAGSDQARLVLQGAYIDVSDSKNHHIVGTDGRCLYANNAFHFEGLTHSIVLPMHKVWTSSLLKKPCFWKLQISRPNNNGESRFRIETEDWSFSGALIDSKYPNFRQVIPGENEKVRVTISERDSADILGLLKKMPASKKVQCIGLSVTNGVCEFLFPIPDADAFFKVALEARCYPKNRATQRAFLNSEHLMRALEIGFDQFNLYGDLSPVIIRNQQSDLMVAMQVKLNRDLKIKHRPKVKRPNHKVDMTSSVVAQKRKSSSSKSISQPDMKPPIPKQNQNTSTMDKSIEEPLKVAAEEIASVKEALKMANNGLIKALSALKEAGQEQRRTRKDIKSIQGTLRSLRKLDF